MHGDGGAQIIYLCTACFRVWVLTDDQAATLLRELNPTDIAVLARREPPGNNPTGCQSCQSLMTSVGVLVNDPTEDEPTQHDHQIGDANGAAAPVDGQLSPFRRFWDSFKYMYGCPGLIFLVGWFICSAWLADGGRGHEGSVPEALIAVSAFIVSSSLVALVYAKQSFPESEGDRQRLTTFSNFAAAIAIFTMLGIGLAVLYMADITLGAVNGASMVGFGAFFFLGMSLIGHASLIFKLASLPTAPVQPR